MAKSQAKWQAQGNPGDPIAYELDLTEYKLEAWAMPRSSAARRSYWSAFIRKQMPDGQEPGPDDYTVIASQLLDAQMAMRRAELYLQDLLTAQYDEVLFAQRARQDAV